MNRTPTPEQKLLTATARKHHAVAEGHHKDALAAHTKAADAASNQPTDANKLALADAEARLAAAQTTLENSQVELDKLNPSFATRLVKKLVAAVRPAAAPISTTRELAKKFSADAGKLFVEPAELEILTRADANWRDAWTDRNEKFTPDAANKAFQNQITAQSKFSGNKGFEATRTRGAESIRTEFEAKSQAAELRMIAIGDEVQPIVRAVLTRFIESGDDWIEKRLKQERTECEELGIPFAPTPVLGTAQRLVAQTKIRLQNLSVGGVNPADIVNNFAPKQ